MCEELSRAITESKLLFRNKWSKMIEDRGYNVEVAQFDVAVRNRHMALWLQFIKGLETDKFEPYLALIEGEGRLQARASSRIESLLNQLSAIMNLTWDVISSTPAIKAKPALLLPLTRTMNNIRLQAENAMLKGYLEESALIEQERAAESAQMRRIRMERTNLQELIKSVRSFRLVRYTQGQLIYQPGDSRAVIYFIMAGRVRLYEILPDARAITLSILGKHDVFAQSTDRGNYFHDVYAESMQDSLVACIQEDALASLMEEAPLLGSRIINSFSQQLSQSQVLIEGLIGRDVGMRLVSILLKLAEEFGIACPSGAINIELGLTHQELADMIGSNRVTVTRKLAQLQEKKLIRVAKGIVSIVNKQTLEELVA